MGITRHRDLRDGTPVWGLAPHPSIRGKRLLRSTRAEVVVVGAGISGALVAQSLCEYGFRPVILDRRRTALLGSTAASTALLQFELDEPLCELSRSIGPRKAARVWTASRNAVNDLRTLTHRLKIEAHFKTRPSLYLAGNVLDGSGLRREAALRQRIGISSEFLDRHELRRHFGVDRDAAILNHGNAEADPVLLAAGYLRRAVQAGAKFHAPHDVVDLRCGRGGTTLMTHDGIEILARHVVLCTGYELPHVLPPSSNRIASTWAIATRPQPKFLWPQKALIWEASEPYLYLRTTYDGRVICGGEDQEFSDSAKRDLLTATKTRRIETKLKKLFPKLDSRAATAWAGSFGESQTGMPTIGGIPGYRRCYAVMGFGGNGITFSMLARKLITAAIRGKKDSDAPLFAFH